MPKPWLTQRTRSSTATGRSLPCRHAGSPTRRSWRARKKPSSIRAGAMSATRAICRSPAVTSPAAFVDQNIFVIRNRDGEIKAFHNVCRHRAHELLKGRGQIKAVITCPYHAWAYDSDGALKSARLSDGVRGFDKADFGLAPRARRIDAGAVVRQPRPRRRALRRSVRRPGRGDHLTRPVISGSGQGRRSAHTQTIATPAST